MTNLKLKKFWKGFAEAFVGAIFFGVVWLLLFW